MDKWLWFARMVKHRSMAAALIESGRVRLNHTKVLKPGHVIRPADVLTIIIQDNIRVLRVKDLGTRRGPFAEACQLYEDLSAPSETSSTSEKVRA